MLLTYWVWTHLGLPGKQLHVPTIVTEGMPLRLCWVIRVRRDSSCFFFLWRELRCDLYFIPSPSFLPRLAGPFNVSPVCSTFLSVTFLEPPDKQAYCQSCGSFYGQMRCLQTFSFSLFPSSKRRVCTKKKVTVRVQNYLPVKNYSSAILSVSLFNGNRHTWGKEEKLLLLKI